LGTLQMNISPRQLYCKLRGSRGGCMSAFDLRFSHYEQNQRFMYLNSITKLKIFPNSRRGGISSQRSGGCHMTLALAIGTSPKLNIIIENHLLIARKNLTCLLATYLIPS
jgi:hypothetical protein